MSARFDLVCGVDGGGTGCRAVLARPDGTILARAESGPANFTTDPARAVAHVREALTTALGRAGCAGQDPARIAAHVGLAGILTSAQAEALRAALPFGRCGVSDDRETSVAGAFGPRAGAMLAIGTGSFGALRRDGRTRYFGGWGLMLGDQASGGWLGRCLLEQVLVIHDGLAPPSDLTRAVLAEFGADPAAIVAFAGQARPGDYAAFAPRIVAAEQEGDAVARALMQRGAAYLERILAQADIAGDEILCLVGGLGPQYGRHLAPRLQARLAPPEGSALDGALSLARRALDGASAPT